MIKYVEGDLFALLPKQEKRIFVPHIVNNIYTWGSGFVIPLGRKWPAVKAAYLSRPKLELGEVDFIQVEKDKPDQGAIWVCNMVGQNRIFCPDNLKPIKYYALIRCLNEVGKAVRSQDGCIHAPKFGSDRAKGNWSFIEDLIYELWENIPVTIYSL